jgi:hypothetical protein
MKTVLVIVSGLAWCGSMYGYALFLKQLRASGYSIWTWDHRARFNAWRGRPIVIFTICMAIFAGLIGASITFR